MICGRMVLTRLMGMANPTPLTGVLKAVPMMRIFLRPMLSANHPAGMTEITMPRVEAIASSPRLMAPRYFPLSLKFWRSRYDSASPVKSIKLVLTETDLGTNHVLI